MVAATEQSQAIQTSNSVLSLAAQSMALFITITDVVNKWNDQGVLAVANALATAAQNTDGSLGTADGTPNNAHPIDTRVAANTGLARAISSNNLASIVTFLTNYQNLVNGVTVTGVAGTRSLLNQAIGG